MSEVQKQVIKDALSSVFPDLPPGKIEMLFNAICLAITWKIANT